MSSVSTWISEYGYAAVFGGTVIEGESIAIMAGIAARHGYLDVYLTVAVAALGGMLGDLTMYWLGRRYGESLLSRFGRHQSAIERVRTLVRTRPVVAVLGVRFAYGLRVAGPIVIGASGVAPGLFIALNAIGALTWASIVVGIGYGAGEMLHQFVAHHHRHGLWLAIGITGAAIAFLATHLWLRRGRARRASAP